MNDLTTLLRDIDNLRDLDASSTVPTVEPLSPPPPFPTDPDPLSVPVSYIAPEWRDGFFTVAPPTAGRSPESST